MPAKISPLRDNLSRTDEINLSVIGRKSGRTSSRPVWFAVEGNNLFLLPVEGSDTQWYQNVVKNPKIRLEANRVASECKAIPIIEPTEVAAVVERFRKKYGPGNVKKYYSKFDVAVLVPLE